jgi:hypothetical protein
MVISNKINDVCIELNYFNNHTDLTKFFKLYNFKNEKLASQWFLNQIKKDDIENNLEYCFDITELIF